MKVFFTKIILFLVMLCSVTYSYCQDRLTLKKGKVINSLMVPSSKGVYSIYLPKSFDMNKGWPILFGFDNTGNMSSLANTFSKSAEENEYILVVSNFGEKLSTKDKLSYVSVFMKHIFSLFPVLNERIYIFGVGDDAAFNSTLPVVYKLIDGVLAIGNSNDYNQKITPDKNFSFIGMIGNKNFRYQDFLKTNEYLKRKNIASDVYVYEGNDELPSEDIIEKALPYFTLEAMISGSIPKDSVWIANRYKKELNEVKVLKEKKQYLQAFDELVRMRNRYRSFFDVDELKKEQKEIRKIDGYKKQKRIRSKYKNRELFLRQIFTRSLEEDIAFIQYDNLGWWQYRMDELDKLKRNKEEYADHMVFRLRGFLKNVLFQFKKELSNGQSEMDRKIFLNILNTIVDKNDYESYRNIISLSAIDGDNETALFYLEKMLQNGYKEIEPLYTIEGTLSLRISKAYNNIIKKYLGSSKFFSFE